ncbi:MAG: lamin tail domain-containing protein, partial [Chitinophagales bacterium]
SVSGVEDLAGNSISLAFTTFSYYTIQQYDIIIDEAMADPDPSVGMPNAEYIELYNTTDLDIEITNFYISDATSSSDVFPAFTLAGNAYVIITDDANAGLFDVFGDVLYVNNFPSLNNDGDDLQLVDDENNLLHAVNYTTDWYQDVIKSEGGYSLEMIDVNFPCQGENNWNASSASNGGTPGTVNAVSAENPDNIAPSVLSAFPPTLDSLLVSFDEALDAASISASNFSVDNSIGTANSASFDTANPTTVKLFFPTTFSENILYTVTCSEVKDCSGNEALLNNTAQFGIAVPADSFDVVINEVLFNPATDGLDYVELYNRSGKFIDVSKIYLAEYNLEDTTTISELTAITLTPTLLLPDTYMLITENIENVAENYFISETGNFIQNLNTPNYPDDEGIVAIQTFDGTLLDRLHFYNDWHFALLDDEDGVSLERVNYNATTQDANNWHSASEDKHFGTPGYQNSVFGEITGTENNFSLEYEVFSPDGDGFLDLLILNYNNIAAGTVASVIIFDAQGRTIKQLTNNETFSSEGFLTWDGVNADDEIARTGIYIAYAEFFDLSGKVQKEKLKFTLARKQ